MKVGAIAVFLVAAALPAGSENLLLNPGFEHGPAHGAWPDSWGCYGWCGQEFWASRQGSNGVAFWTWNDGAWGGCWQDVSLSPDPGDRLLFSIWGLAESNFISSKEEAWIQIEMYTADSDTAVETVRAEVYNRLVSHSEQWVPLAVEAIVPTISLSRITVKFGGGGFINGGHHQAVMWDDACLSVLPGRRLSSVIDGTGTIRLCWPADTQRYFQIWAATDIRGPWTWLRDVILGNGLSNVWADPGIVAQFDQLFYRVVAVPTNAPQDADHDGLDDMAELTREGLDPADPDSDDDTIPAKMDGWVWGGISTWDSSKGQPA
ncbi:MAG TPA: hypothetical protein EYP62_09010, partial [Kiritimatiellae bacterium]|nr:hypothetical protein [Kiritimatiellia bacterium]